MLMPYAPALISILALLLYQVLSFNVGRARGRYAIPAPATTGSPEFERVYRVQMNTLEQLVFFLPALWLFFAFAPLDEKGYRDVIGAALGALWIIGRIIYARGYYKAANKRTAGFAIGMLAANLLLLGAVYGVATGPWFVQS